MLNMYRQRTAAPSGGTRRRVSGKQDRCDARSAAGRSRRDTGECRTRAISFSRWNPIVRGPHGHPALSRHTRARDRRRRRSLGDQRGRSPAYEWPRQSVETDLLCLASSGRPSSDSFDSSETSVRPNNRWLLGLSRLIHSRYNYSHNETLALSPTGLGEPIGTFWKGWCLEKVGQRRRLRVKTATRSVADV